MPGDPLFCDVSLPVPLDQAFTYRMPETLRHRVQAGCRVLAPLGTRTLTGLVLRTHLDPPPGQAREILRLLDEEPALDDELLQLGKWIAEFYCAPLGETLRAMTPLAGEIRRGKVYSLTKTGRDVARQLHLGSDGDTDPAATALRMLDARPLSASYLKQKIQNAAAVLKSLEKKGFVVTEDVAAERDPLRASAARLRIEFVARAEKLPKAERELLSYLELHPGSHNVADLEALVAKASTAARSLARRELVRLTIEQMAEVHGPIRTPHALNPHQQAAFDCILGALDRKQYQTFLLQGVTGSGKTEVYLKAIDAALALGRSALMLVPEIGLTPAVAGQFYQRFPGRVAILHSAFQDSERAQEWRRIRSGEAAVVVATRSGVFAPVRDLGLIIVDEEHDQSYKQQETPRYHGRDVALVRARNAGAVAILGSATPAVESRFNAGQGKYELLLLPERIAKRPLPEVEVVDMRVEFLETKRQATFSRTLTNEIAKRLANREQTMLLLNRRGFSSFMVCRACGERLLCENCSVVLTYHRRDRRMLCHYCGFAAKVPSVCPACTSDHIQFLGTGSERVEDELHLSLPTARIARLDRDSASGKGAFENILSAFREGLIDILVGTQMIAKGHDIPNVTLVGIVLADIGLSLPDFRAAERSFQLLTQAAGRAGRGDTPGRVVIQTLNPDHYAIRFAAAQDYEGFYQKEIEFRKWLRYPPFAAFANVLVRAAKQEDALRMATQLGYLLDPQPEGVRVMGPAEAPVLRVKSEFRYQILLKAASRVVLRDILRQLRAFAEKEKWKPTALVIDVDPISLM